jgi:glutamine synthetase
LPTRRTDGTRFPFSVLNLDIWGEDIEDSPLVFRAGDPDGVLKPTERGYLPVPWLASPTALLPIWMFHEDGRPYDGDPRQALARVIDRYTALGLTPVVATELEFYLIDDRGKEPRVPPSPRSGKRRHQAEILALRQLDAWGRVLHPSSTRPARRWTFPPTPRSPRPGPGQFEVNLMHQPDALKAADDAWLFKLLVKGLAREHGVAASFMANPTKTTRATGCMCISRCSTATGPTSSTKTTKAARSFSAMPSAGALRRCRARC